MLTIRPNDVFLLFDLFEDALMFFFFTACSCRLSRLSTLNIRHVRHPKTLRLMDEDDLKICVL